MANFFKAVAKPKASNQPLTVSIEKLDINGVGVARWKNKPMFVAGALPNEIVNIKILEQKNKYARAKLLSVENKSNKRVEAECQHFGLCGGCDLQMLNIEDQLAFKQRKVTELYSRSFSAQGIANAGFQQILPWQEPIKGEAWYYRRKARIGVQFDKQAQATIGFRQKSTNQLAAIKSCPVLVKPLNLIFPLLKKILPQLAVKSAIGHIEVIQADIIDSNFFDDKQKGEQKDKPKPNQVVLVIRQLKPMNEADKQLWQSYAREHCWHIIIDNGNKQVPLSENQVDNPVELSYTLADNNKINFASSDFIQINHSVNIAMINQALTWLALSTTDNVLDLFCGLGNFSLALAKQCQSVIGVEGVQVMVDKASKNAQLNNIDNCQFHQADLNDDWLLQSWATKQRFDKVLLDPARAGAEYAVSQIVKLNIPTILYVSCDPATLARDSAILVAKGYTLKKISLMDMFSQTKHVETMVLFTK
jgi:23S rRNA (uracil1939-C5)-methyltransferase